MSLGRRAVDGLTLAGIGARQRVKQPTPNPAHRPGAKAIVDRCRRPVDGRAILPPIAGLQNVDDAADDPPIRGSFAFRAGSVGVKGRKTFTHRKGHRELFYKRRLTKLICVE